MLNVNSFEIGALFLIALDAICHFAFRAAKEEDASGGEKLAENKKKKVFMPFQQPFTFRDDKKKMTTFADRQAKAAAASSSETGISEENKAKIQDEKLNA